MAAQRLIVAIGRIERALSKVEQLPSKTPLGGDAELAGAHEKLKMETKAAIADIDRILAGGN